MRYTDRESILKGANYYGEEKRSIQDDVGEIY